MSEKNKKSSPKGKGLEDFVLTLGKFSWYVLQISFHGLKRAVFNNVDRVLWLIVGYGLILVLVYWNWMHLRILHLLFPKIITLGVMKFFVYHVPQYMQFLMLTSGMTIVIGVVFGFAHFFRMVRYQKELKHIGLKSATGGEPKVIDVEKTSDFKIKITLTSPGIGLDHYKNKKSDLESAFGAIVEDIRISQRSRKLVEIHLVEKELPTLVNFSQCVGALKEPNSFLVGESLGGIIAQPIRSLPHLMIAGTSGNGKSVFFNQTLISMLKTSPHIQLYLLDLKLGVEVKAYRNLPNVKIAKDESEAVHLLKSVVAEMKERFKLLEQNGNKIIDPERDGKDLILVGVDEASVLYGKRRGQRNGPNHASTARELTDEIAKLGRAACIHLVMATQKVTNDTIDTKIQENVGGRICFRVGSLQGSNTVIGNKKANELPDLKGRAIWAYGNTFTEVQTPFISDQSIDDEISIIIEDFATQKRKCLQPLISDLHTTVKTVEEQNIAIENEK